MTMSKIFRAALIAGITTGIAAVIMLKITSPTSVTDSKSRHAKNPTSADPADLSEEEQTQLVQELSEQLDL